MSTIERREASPYLCMEVRGGSRAIEESVSTPGLECWVYSRPFEGDEAGGDVHYLSVCGGGVVTRLIVADVSGHGSTVAAYSEALRGLMRKNINTKSQARLVGALNSQFLETAEFLRFATAVVATYLADKKTLTVCNAGHPRPLHYSAADRAWVALDAPDERPGNLPLGLDERTPYRQFSLGLSPGDVVVFYTDALTEAVSPEGRMLMEEGLLDLARGLDMTDPRGAGRSLVSAVDAHRGGAPSDDDVTVLTLHHDGRRPKRPSPAQTLGVFAKLLGLKKY